MKKFLFMALIFGLGIYLCGCGKKQQTLEEMQQPMSMETLTSMNTTSPTTPQATEVKTDPFSTTISTATVAAKTGKLEALPPSGPYKPTNMEIQTALKNANFYMGEVDGKLGPKTKKAILEFQKANGLSADGKVGPKTWIELSKFLSIDSSTQATTKSR